MLTTPYKVLIAGSALLLLGAVGFRVTELFAGGADAPVSMLAVVNRDAEEPAVAGVDRPEVPTADLLPPVRRDPVVSDSPAARAPARVETPPAARVDGPAAEAVDAPPAPAVSPDLAEEVPTLVIGRQPGEPRAERGAAAASASAPDAVEARAERIYVVQPGDSLQRIAERTLGDANRWSAIAERNPGVDPLRLQLGDRLRLPAGATVAAVAKPAPAEAAAGSGGIATRHRVRPGDSLSVIALRYYGNSQGWRRIFEANRDVMDSPDDLGIGVELAIPGVDAGG